MAIGVEENIVGLDVTVYNVLTVDVAQCASHFGNPEPYRLFGERLPRDVKAQVAASHEVHNNISASISQRPCAGTNRQAYRYSTSWKLYLKLQRKG